MAILIPYNRRVQRLFLTLVLTAGALLVLYAQFYPRRGKWRPFYYVSSSFDWAHREQRHPIDPTTMARLPSGTPKPLRRIQYNFTNDAPDRERARVLSQRRNAVKNAFRKSWESYREYAWGYDELIPKTLLGLDTYSGWGATLVDSLDSLWIMGLQDDFHQAVHAVASIDWDNSTSRSCSVFETNIRYLGGLLAAHELSGEQVLLKKALELGHMLYTAFDTPGRMPANSFYFRRARYASLSPSTREAAASVGTLSLEFTKLAQLTGEMKFYDAIDRIKDEMARTQDQTRLPGLWPTYINLHGGFGVEDDSFTLGGLADSMYEYLSKEYALLGGLDETYEKMHRKALNAATEHLLYRPMTPNREDILFTGSAVIKRNKVELTAESQHLACFAGGMYALGGKLFDIPRHVEIGEKLARGCAWAYSVFPTGVMPEIAELVACETPNHRACEWSEARWEASKSRWKKKLPRGVTRIVDSRYILRPEAIESLFLLYRVTGQQDLQDIAWTMFEAIKEATEVPFAFSAIQDVNVRGQTAKTDSMESFWLAETLKYFYLIFSDPNLISLDDYVLNTEAHPFKIPKPPQ